MIFAAPKDRLKIRSMLAQQEQIFPETFESILQTVLSLMKMNGKGKRDEWDEEEEIDKVASCDTGTCCSLMN